MSTDEAIEKAKAVEGAMSGIDSLSAVPILGLLGMGMNKQCCCPEPDERHFARTILLTKLNCFKDNYSAVKALRAWKEVADDLIKACEYIFPSKEADNAHY